MKVLVTGAAGFIGMHVAERLLGEGCEVVGLDNLNAYYDPTLKQARLARLEAYEHFRFARLDLAQREPIMELFRKETFERVVHLAAQAGVRHSLDAPHDYIEANVVGTLNVLEGCRYTNVEHLVYASTSSVYGLSTDMPFSPHADAEHPLAIYPASKRATELMAHSYAYLFGLPTTGLRFFTVYGPWGRPDMALFRFTRQILAGEPIELYNHGQHGRDFTYIDDIAEGVRHAVHHTAASDPSWDSNAPDAASSSAPWRIYNLGHGEPVPLMRYVELLEHHLGRNAERRLLPMQPGDIAKTSADVSDLSEAIGYVPSTPVEAGVKRFVEWYREFYQG